MDTQEQSRWVIERARELGFDLCGIAPAVDFEELTRLPEWLARGYAGEMRYLEDRRRSSPARVLDGARSLIVCALNYNTPLPYSTEVPRGTGIPVCPDAPGPRGWISRYAWGDDYHGALGERLEALLGEMRANIPKPFEARAYVDTGPLVERVAARYAGLGWLAKNTCLINETLGSWLFLGVIVTTLDLTPTLRPQEAPPPDLCGSCTLCIEACPTGALVEPYLLDARRCISYLTIEHRGIISEELREPMGRHMFGCDICQDVCPWNRKAPASLLAAFQPRRIAGEDDERPLKSEKRSLRFEDRNSESGSGHRPALSPPEADEGPLARPEPAGDERGAIDHLDLFAPPLEWLASLREEEFRRIFSNSPIKRTKWRGVVRNACVALGNAAAWLEPAARKRVAALLERLAASSDALIAEHARWALGRL